MNHVAGEREEPGPFETETIEEGDKPGATDEE